MLFTQTRSNGALSETRVFLPLTLLRQAETSVSARPLRTLYAFDPRRSAILLIGGEKTGDDRWYEKFVPVADRIYERHLRELEKEGST